MALKDQLNKLRDYFVDDSDDYDDYEDYEEYEEPAAPAQRVAPVSQPQSAPVSQNYVRPVQPQPVQQTVRPEVQADPMAGQRTVGANMNYNQNSGQNESATPVRSKSTSNSNSTVGIRTPRVYSEVMEIANHIKAGQTVIINFKNMAEQQARRSIDFLTGIAFCIDGDIKNVGGQIFMVTPAGIEIDAETEMNVLNNSNLDGLDGIL